MSVELNKKYADIQDPTRILVPQKINGKQVLCKVLWRPKALRADPRRIGPDNRPPQQGGTVSIPLVLFDERQAQRVGFVLMTDQ